MTLPPPSEHFQGKSVTEHLKEARTHGNHLSSEMHGTEMSGFSSALCDAAKETAVLLLLLFLLLKELLPQFPFFSAAILFSSSWVIWKAGRSALLGWSRMNRLHRLIEEERWEIEHHRHQERKELTEMYRAKGFEGKLLEEVIDVLMADDNRLLQIMLEEELGLSLEKIDHPLKQAWGALLGAAVASILCLMSFWIHPLFGLPVATFVILLFATIISIRIENNKILNLLIWTLAVAATAAASLHLLLPLS